LQLAPGGHLGRFIVWTRGAFNKLNALWGSQNTEAAEKAGYTLPRPIMANPDVNRLINSDEIQSKVRPSIKTVHRFTQHKNPLTNLGVRVRLNPYALALRRSELLSQERRKAQKQSALETKRVQSLAAANRDHEPQQRVNYQRVAVDDFKFVAAKIKHSKPRGPIAPPKPLTDAQRKAKVDSRKKKPKKAGEKKEKKDEAKEKAEERKRKEAPKLLPKQLLAVATAKVTKIKKASAAGGKKGKKEAGKKEDGKKEAGKAEAGKKEAGKAEAGKKEAGKAEAGKKEAGKKEEPKKKGK